MCTYTPGRRGWLVLSMPESERGWSEMTLDPKRQAGVARRLANLAKARLMWGKDPPPCTCGENWLPGA